MNVLGPKTGYIEMLDEATKARVNSADGTQKKYNPLRPSAAGKCTRQLAYELAEYHGVTTFEKKPREANEQRIFGLGHHVEKHAIYEFNDNLPELELRYKQQVLTFFPLTAKNHPEWSQLVEGSLDTCFWSPETRGVADFKSKKDKFSAFYKTNWDETSEKLARLSSVHVVSDKFYWVENLKLFLEQLNDSFFEMNFRQLNGYACTDFLRARGVDHASIIQYNKNDSRMREIRFKPDPTLFDEIRAKFQSALDAVDAGDIRLAPRDHSFGTIVCAFCPYSKDCWERDDALKAYFQTFPPRRWAKRSSELGVIGEELEGLFASYLSQELVANELGQTEDQIIKLLMDNKLEKVSLANGNVYELKYYRSPRPHFELKRSKL